jgi:hypothetical protein
MFEIDWQICFLNLLLPYKLNIFRLKCEKDEKSQVYFNTLLMQKWKNIMFHLQVFVCK